MVVKVGFGPVVRTVMRIGLVSAVALVAPTFAGPQTPSVAPAELRPRIGLAEYADNDPSAELMGGAVTAVLYDRIDATWIPVGSAQEAVRFGIELLVELSATVVAELEDSGPDEDAAAAQPDAARRRDRRRTGPLIEVVLGVVRLDRNSGAQLELLEEVRLVRELDLPGRYQRAGLWADAVEAVQSHLSIAANILTVTFTSDHAVEVFGLPPYARTGLPTTADERAVVLSGSHRIDLVRDRSYVLELRATGRSLELVEFYLGSVPLELDLSLRRYPRFAVGAHLRGLSWPGLGFRWYPRGGRLAVGVDITSYLGGLTPLDSRGNHDLLGGHPLIEIALGVDYRFAAPDQVVRPFAGLAVVPRFTTPPIGFQFEPILPVALRVGAGLDWQHTGPFRPYARLATDLLWVANPRFVPQTAWAAEYDAVVIQFPIIEVGARWAF